MASRLEADIVTQEIRKAMAAIEKIGKGPLLRSVIHGEFSCAITSEFEEHVPFPDLS